MKYTQFSYGIINEFFLKFTGQAISNEQLKLQLHSHWDIYKKKFVYECFSIQKNKWRYLKSSVQPSMMSYFPADGGILCISIVLQLSTWKLNLQQLIFIETRICISKHCSTILGIRLLAARYAISRHHSKMTNPFSLQSLILYKAKRIWILKNEIKWKWKWALAAPCPMTYAILKYWLSLHLRCLK